MRRWSGGRRPGSGRPRPAGDQVRVGRRRRSLRPQRRVGRLLGQQRPHVGLSPSLAASAPVTASTVPASPTGRARTGVGVGSVADLAVGVARSRRDQPPRRPRNRPHQDRLARQHHPHRRWPGGAVRPRDADAALLHLGEMPEVAVWHRVHLPDLGLPGGTRPRPYSAAPWGGYGCAVGSGRAAAPLPAVGAGRRGSLTPAGGGPPAPGRGVDRRLCSSPRHQPVQPPTAPGRSAGSVMWRMLSS